MILTKAPFVFYLLLFHCNYIHQILQFWNTKCICLSSYLKHQIIFTKHYSPETSNIFQLYSPYWTFHFVLRALNHISLPKQPHCRGIFHCKFFPFLFFFKIMENSFSFISFTLSFYKVERSFFLFHVWNVRSLEWSSFLLHVWNVFFL
jgi:hypothetical protein